MDLVLVTIQFLHILAGVVWLGGSMSMTFFVLPAVFAQPVAHQRALARLVILGPERLMVGAALTTLVLGVVRGTVYGPVHSVDALGTRYGNRLDGRHRHHTRRVRHWWTADKPCRTVLTR